MPTAAAIYTRVMGDAPGSEENRSSVQVMKCRDHCRKNAFTISDDHVFVETRPSVGHDGNRPIFDEMMKLAMSGAAPFKVIVVLEFDRFMRDRDLREITRERLLVHGVKVVSIKDGTRAF